MNIQSVQKNIMRKIEKKLKNIKKHIIKIIKKKQMNIKNNGIKIVLIKPQKRFTIILQKATILTMEFNMV